MLLKSQLLTRGCPQFYLASWFVELEGRRLTHYAANLHELYLLWDAVFDWVSYSLRISQWCRASAMMPLNLMRLSIYLKKSTVNHANFRPPQFHSALRTLKPMKPSKRSEVFFKFCEHNWNALCWCSMHTNTCVCLGRWHAFGVYFPHCYSSCWALAHYSSGYTADSRQTTGKTWLTSALTPQ